MTDIVIYKVLKHSSVSYLHITSLTDIVIYKVLKHKYITLPDELRLTDIVIYKVLKQCRLRMIKILPLDRYRNLQGSQTVNIIAK